MLSDTGRRGRLPPVGRAGIGPLQREAQAQSPVVVLASRNAHEQYRPRHRYYPDKSQTHVAFEGCRLAKDHGKGNEYNQRVLQAFFVEGQDIGQIDVLTRLAGEVGLNEKAFEEALRTRKYRQAHQQALRHAYEEAGVTGVPMFVIGSQVLTGLQHREALEVVIEEEMG
jgi:predicted DsbA family dithiol-disulfide isomerase